jgi:hypothetical protein
VSGDNVALRFPGVEHCSEDHAQCGESNGVASHELIHRDPQIGDLLAPPEVPWHEQHDGSSDTAATEAAVWRGLRGHPPQQWREAEVVIPGNGTRERCEGDEDDTRSDLLSAQPEAMRTEQTSASDDRGDEESNPLV